MAMLPLSLSLSELGDKVVEAGSLMPIVEQISFFGLALGSPAETLLMLERSLSSGNLFTKNPVMQTDGRMQNKYRGSSVHVKVACSP